MTREEDGQLSTRVYRKPSNTNVTIKPHSCQHPDTYKGIFKAELCRAYRLCSSAEKTQKEIRYVTDLFEDNGFNRKELEKIADEYKPSEKPKGRNKQYQQKTNSDKNDNPENLFDVLPFRDTDAPGTEEERKPYVVMPYLPDGVYHQMRRACKKAGVQLVTRSGTKLKDLLCAPNKTHHDKGDKPGIYKLTCPCSEDSVYIGQTIRPISTRVNEHLRLLKRGNGPTQVYLNTKRLVKKK